MNIIVISSMVCSTQNFIFTHIKSQHLDIDILSTSFVIRKQYKSLNSSKVRFEGIDISDLQPGFYMLRTKINGEFKIFKFIKN